MFETVCVPKVVAIFPRTQSREFAPTYNLTKETFGLRKVILGAIGGFIIPFLYALYNFRDRKKAIVETMRQITMIQEKTVVTIDAGNGVLISSKPL